MKTRPPATNPINVTPGKTLPPKPAPVPVGTRAPKPLPDLLESSFAPASPLEGTGLDFLPWAGAVPFYQGILSGSRDVSREAPAPKPTPSPAAVKSAATPIPAPTPAREEWRDYYTPPAYTPQYRDYPLPPTLLNALDPPKRDVDAEQGAQQDAMRVGLLAPALAAALGLNLGNAQRLAPELAATAARGTGAGQQERFDTLLDVYKLGQSVRDRGNQNARDAYNAQARGVDAYNKAEAERYEQAREEAKQQQAAKIYAGTKQRLESNAANRLTAQQQAEKRREIETIAKIAGSPHGVAGCPRRKRISPRMSSGFPRSVSNRCTTRRETISRCNGRAMSLRRGSCNSVS